MSGHSVTTNTSTPLLLLASDCVYFEHLYEPLEQTIANILSHVSPTSICLIAGVRGWKRDTAFFTQLGKRTKTRTHELSCICIHEQVLRSDTTCIPTTTSITNLSSSSSKRYILRIYAIQWIPRIVSPTPILSLSQQEMKLQQQQQQPLHNTFLFVVDKNMGMTTYHPISSRVNLSSGRPISIHERNRKNTVVEPDHHDELLDESPTDNKITTLTKHMSRNYMHDDED